jgi:hypothetical protein
MEYKSYIASVEYDAHDRILVGHLVGIDAIVGFHGATIDELEQHFKESVDHYLEISEREGLVAQKPCIGASLEEFLKEEGVVDETRARALKEVLAWEISQAMEKNKINKVEMARWMNTSRAALDRLLDPSNTSVTLQTLSKAARAIGREIRVELV